MKADDMIALINAHLAGDNDRFRATVHAIAANTEASSPRTARTLRQLADRTPKTGGASVLTPLPTNMDGLLAQVPTTTKLDDMELEPETRHDLRRVLDEHAARDKLAAHGLAPQRKLLLSGPPGVGKTMAARALAGELDLPFFFVQLHGVIASHLGETSAHLAKVFGSIRTFRGVYLFDEFDALSGQRGSGEHDVAEMRRVVNSLLMLIEQDQSDSLILAATNHADLIDRAMFRRFDAVIEFPLPSQETAVRLIESSLVVPGRALRWEQISTSAIGIGHADLVAACQRVCKDAVIANRDVVFTEDICDAIEARRIRMSDHPDSVARDDRDVEGGVTQGDIPEGAAARMDDEGRGGRGRCARSPLQDAGMVVRDLGDPLPDRQ